MTASDPLDSNGKIGADGGMVTESTEDTGWEVVAEHQGAAALIGALLQLDPAERYTKTELSDATGVAYKTLYLDGPVEALVDVGFLECDTREGEEATYQVDPDSRVYDAAAAFDDVATSE